MHWKKALAAALIIGLAAVVAMTIVAAAVFLGLKDQYLTAMSTVISTAFAAIAVVISVAESVPRAGSSKDVELRERQAAVLSGVVFDGRSGVIRACAGDMQIVFEFPPEAVKIASNSDQSPPMV